MLKRSTFAPRACAFVVAAAVIAAGTSGAGAAPTNDQSVETSLAAKAPAKRGVTMAASTRQTVEGSRYTLTASVRSPKQAGSITIQKFDPPDYSFQEPEWDDVKTIPVRGRAEFKLVVVATERDSERYRAVVRYKKAKPVTSKPAAVTIWRWIPLSEYDPYYETGGTTFGTFGINGVNYKGWGPSLSSYVNSWEARFTPGRHCIAFKGVLGLDDDSDDGASGTVAIISDDRPLYTSPMLTPGMAEPVTVALSKPYRLGLRLTDTTPGGTDGHDVLEAYPSIGDPALLCSGA